MTSFKERLNDINTLIFDVDGVLTDGSVTLYKDEVVRTLNSRDGYALQYASKMGYNIFIISGGTSEDVKKRLLNLGVKEVYMGSKNKIKIYESIKEKHDLHDNQIAYMGDDIPDYQVMQKVGLAACPQDAAVEIKQVSHYQSPFMGGKHCVRDIIEQVLRVQENWFTEKSFEW